MLTDFMNELQIATVIAAGFFFIVSLLKEHSKLKPMDSLEPVFPGQQK